MTTQPKYGEVWGDPKNPLTWRFVCSAWGCEVGHAGFHDFRVMTVEPDVRFVTGKTRIFPPAPFDPESLRVPQTPTSGVNAIVGKWPEESKEGE